MGRLPTGATQAALRQSFKRRLQSCGEIMRFQWWWQTRPRVLPATRAEHQLGEFRTNALAPLHLISASPLTFPPELTTRPRTGARPRAAAPSPDGQVRPCLTGQFPVNTGRDSPVRLFRPPSPPPDLTGESGSPEPLTASPPPPPSPAGHRGPVPVSTRLCFP